MEFLTWNPLQNSISLDLIGFYLIATFLEPLMRLNRGIGVQA